MHQVLDTLPLFGDTTSNQAIIFSPPFDHDSLSITQPSFPNYTLPPANLSFPSPPASPPNFTLFIAPTDSSVLTSSLRTGCALQSLQGPGIFQFSPGRSLGLWPRDTNGWRWQWLVNGLTPSTNYTAYAIDGTAVSGPIFFATKSGMPFLLPPYRSHLHNSLFHPASFVCPLVHSLPYCPSTAYAVPLPPPSDSGSTQDYTADNLPSTVVKELLSGFTNFTTMLTTMACGRDNYSPIVSCADCQAAYRTWLCAVSFPRCSEQPSSSSQTSSGPTQSTPTPALIFREANEPARNLNFPNITSSYDELLPCLETCNAVDRACPVFLGFRCPTPNYRANVSYGVGFIDNGEEDIVGWGSTGTAQDQFGNVWCNPG